MDRPSNPCRHGREARSSRRGVPRAAVSRKDYRCRVVGGGCADSCCGLNLRGKELDAPALSERDLRDLEVAMGIGVDAPRNDPATAKCTQEIVYRSVLATYRAGGHGDQPRIPDGIMIDFCQAINGGGL